MSGIEFKVWIIRKLNKIQRRSKTNTKKLQKQSRKEKKDTYFGKKPRI